MLQLVKKETLNVRRNLIQTMERNSELTRADMYLERLDEESVSAMAFFDMRCIPSSHRIAEDGRGEGHMQVVSGGSWMLT